MAIKGSCLHFLRQALYIINNLSRKGRHALIQHQNGIVMIYHGMTDISPGNLHLIQCYIHRSSSSQSRFGLPWHMLKKGLIVIMLYWSSVLFSLWSASSWSFPLSSKCMLFFSVCTPWSELKPQQNMTLMWWACIWQSYLWHNRSELGSHIIIFGIYTCLW